jgi:hypothetical protein
VTITGEQQCPCGSWVALTDAEQLANRGQPIKCRECRHEPYPAPHRPRPATTIRRVITSSQAPSTSSQQRKSSATAPSRSSEQPTQPSLEQVVVIKPNPYSLHDALAQLGYKTAQRDPFVGGHEILPVGGHESPRWRP